MANEQIFDSIQFLLKKSILKDILMKFVAHTFTSKLVNQVFFEEFLKIDISPFSKENVANFEFLRPAP